MAGATTRDGWAIAQEVLAALAGPAPMDLRDRVVLVTGGTRGLGLATARAFAARGARLAICGRDGKTLDAALRDLADRGATVLGVRCDLAERAQAEALVAAVLEHYDGLDVLVNNAAVMAIGPVETYDVEDLEAVMAADFWSAAYTTMAALPALRASRGRVANVASIGGRLAVPHMLPYTCAKFALRGFSEGLAEEVAKDGIAVTTVLPGLMRTGGPLNAFYNGRRKAEFAWMAALDAMPGISMDAGRAADRIVDAVRRGDAELTLTPVAEALGLLHDLAPAAFVRLAAAANAFLPPAPPLQDSAGPLRGLAVVSMTDFVGPARPVIEAGEALNQFAGSRHR